MKTLLHKKTVVQSKAARRLLGQTETSKFLTQKIICNPLSFQPKNVISFTFRPPKNLQLSPREQVNKSTKVLHTSLDFILDGSVISAPASHCNRSLCFPRSTNRQTEHCIIRAEGFNPHQHMSSAFS